MTKRKYLIGCTTVALMLASAACQGKTPSTDSKGTESQASSDPSSTVSDPFGKYQPGIEVTAVRRITEGTKFVNGESIDNNPWSRAYEEALGIKVKYMWTAPEAQYDQKSNIVIATGDLPDVMQVNATQLKKMADDGQLEDLTQLYSQFAAPSTKQLLAEDGGNALKSATFGGKLLALPKMDSGFGQTDVLWVRSDWLKKLNLTEPKTMDDVFKISEAFTTKDPDGNQKADTVGLGINKDIGGFFASMDGFFNGYHAYPNIWIKDASGKLVYGSIQPEMKTALQKLHELYQTGQIDKEFGTKDVGKVKEAANAGKLGMLYGYFWNSGSGWLQDGKEANPSAEWTPYPLPSIDGQPAKAQVPFAINTYYVIKKGAKHPEAAIKMLNLALEKIYGKTAEPEKYNVNKEGLAIFNYALLGGEAPRKNLDAHQRVVDALATKDTSKLNIEEKGYYDSSVAFLSGDVKQWGSYMMFGPKSSLSVINGYAKDNRLMNNQFFGAPTETMTQSISTLQKLQMETFTSIIIRGDVNLFDEFVTKWKQLDGDKMTQEANMWVADQK